MTTIESIRTYFIKCPILDSKSPINIDYNGKQPRQYSIDTMPVDPIVAQYTDGASKRRYGFTINSTEIYGPGHRKNLENIGFYELLSEWLEEQNLAKNLPELGEGKIPLYFEILTTGSMFYATENDAVYQIQLSLVYLQNRRNK